MGKFYNTEYLFRKPQTAVLAYTLLFFFFETEISLLKKSYFYLIENRSLSGNFWPKTFRNFNCFLSKYYLSSKFSVNSSGSMSKN